LAEGNENCFAKGVILQEGEKDGPEGGANRGEREKGGHETSPKMTGGESVNPRTSLLSVRSPIGGKITKGGGGGLA